MKYFFTLFFQLLVLFSLGQSEFGKGTLLLLYYTDDSVYLASDTRTSITKTNNTSEIKYRDKLGTSGLFHFATAGSSYLKFGPDTLFTTKGFFSKILSSYKTMADAISYLTTNCSVDLQYAIQSAFDKGATGEAGRQDIHLFICDFENGRPICYAVEFKILMQQKSLSVEKGVKTKFEKYALWSTGDNPLVQEYVKKDHSYLDKLRKNVYKEFLQIFRYVIKKNTSVGMPAIVRTIHTRGFKDHIFYK